MKYIYMFLIILLSFNLYSKEIKFDINGKEEIINIPDNYDDLEKNYIEMCKLYLLAEKDNNKAIVTINNLQKTIIALKKQNNKLLSFSKKSIKSDISFIRPKLYLGFDFNLNKNFNANVGLGLTFIDWISLGFNIRFPDVSIGLFTSIYLTKR